MNVSHRPSNALESLESRLESNHPRKTAKPLRRHYGARGAPGRDHASDRGGHRARRARGDRGRRFGPGRPGFLCLAAGARHRRVRVGFGTRRCAARDRRVVERRRVLGERRRHASAWSRGPYRRVVVGRVRRGKSAGRGAVPTVLRGGEGWRDRARELRRAAGRRRLHAARDGLGRDHRHRGAGRRGDAAGLIPVGPARDELRRARHAGAVRRVRRPGHRTPPPLADARRRRGTSRRDFPPRRRPRVPRDAVRAHRDNRGHERAGVRAGRARGAARAFERERLRRTERGWDDDRDAIVAVVAIVVVANDGL